MKAGKRHIRNGNEYNHLFPKSKGEFVTIKKHGFLNDTLNLMQRVFNETTEDTVKIAALLKGKTDYETCQNVWSFTYHHLQYTLDEKGKEQVRRPARSWKDRKQGVDCDCMSVFIGSILLNLNIPFSLRLTKNNSEEFEHVYPVAHTNNGILILDAVIDQFNQEAPHTEKKDIKIMEVQYLNGADNPPFSHNENENLTDIESYDSDYDDIDDLIDNDYPMDAQGLMLDEELLGLEGRAERKARRAARKAKRQTKRADRKVKRQTRKTERKARNAEIKKLPRKERFKARVKQGFHAVNRFNPGAALLRLGLLASSKLNLMKMASKLRFAYWTETQAIQNHMDISKYRMLIKIREKLEKIFFGAGGRTENLRKAILSGKGNRDKMVQLHGLGAVYTPVYDEDDLRTILGDEIFDSETEDVEDELNGLGVVATASTGAAITAAAGIIGTIAALIKKLGGMFKKGTPQDEQVVLQENTDDEEEKTRKFSFQNLADTVKKVGQNFQNLPQFANKSATPSQDAIEYGTSTPSNQSNFVDMDNDFPPFDDNPTINTRQKPIKSDNDTKDESDKEKEKDPKEGKGDNAFVAWVKENPTPSILIGVGTVGITSFLIYKGIQAKKTKAEEVKKLNSYKKKSTSQEVSGVSKKKKPSVKAKKRKPTAKKQKTRKSRSTIKKVTLL